MSNNNVALDNFSSRLQQFRQDIIGKPTAKKIISRSRIQQTEKRLGTVISKTLVEFYRLVGDCNAIMSGFNSFVPFENLNVDENAVIFCHENQDVVFWAILRDSVDLDDPPVVQGNPDEVGRWYPECRKLSMFLLSMACWQCVNGGLPFAVSGYCSSDDIRRIKRKGEAVAVTGADRQYELKGYTIGSVVICLLIGTETDRVYLAGRSEEELDKVIEMLSISV